MLFIQPSIHCLYPLIKAAYSDMHAVRGRTTRSGHQSLTGNPQGKHIQTTALTVTPKGNLEFIVHQAGMPLDCARELGHPEESHTQEIIQISEKPQLAVSGLNPGPLL